MIRLRGTEVFLLKYADDVCLIASNQSALQISLNRLADYANEFELIINVDKSFCMAFRGKLKSTLKLNVSVGGRPITQVKEFKYLGYYLNETLCLRESAKRMINNANGALAQLSQKVANLHANYPFDIAETMFFATVIPAASYGCEIFGPTRESDLIAIHFSVLNEKPP